MSAAPPSQPLLLARSERWMPLVAVSLAAIAGACDGLAYLSLDNLFVANQTGNVVLMGISIINGQSFETILHSVSLLAYIAGLALTGILVERMVSAGITRILPVIFALQTLLILVAAVVAQQAGTDLADSTAVPLAGGLLAAAMGMQTVALQKVGAWSIKTTFLNGMLSDGTLDIVARIIGRPRSTLVPDPRPLKIAVLAFLIVFTYLVGAAISAQLFNAHGSQGLFVVAAATLLLTLLTVRTEQPALDRRPTPSAPDQP